MIKKKLFFLFFTEGIDPFLTVKSLCGIQYLMWRVNTREQTMRFGHTAGEHRKFSAHLKSIGAKPYARKTLDIAIRELCQKDLLIRCKRGEYYINPKYIWLGHSSDRLAVIKEMKQMKAAKISEETVA